MKSFSFAAVALTSLSALSVSALGISDSDIPTVCQPICKPLVELSSLCSSSSSTDTSCICDNTSFNVVSLGSMCAICCQQANSEDAALSSISVACSFTQGAYNQASASSVAATVVVTATHAGTTATVAATATSTGTAKATGGSSSSTKNAAPAPTAMGAVGLLAGAGAVVAGLVL